MGRSASGRSRLQPFLELPGGRSHIIGGDDRGADGDTGAAGGDDLVDAIKRYAADREEWDGYLAGDVSEEVSGTVFLPRIRG